MTTEPHEPKRRRSTTARRARDRTGPLVIAALAAAPIVPFGTVHEPARAVMAIVLAAGAAWAYRYRGGEPSRLALWMGGSLLFAYATALLWLVPLPDGLIGWTAPSVRSVVAETHRLIGTGSGPAAIYPRGAAIGAAFGLAVTLLGAVTATVVRTSRRAAWLSGALVLAGVATVAVAGVHWGLQIRAPWGLSGWTNPTHGFFGPFVYPNDGGLLCAALVPLAAALGLREDGRYFAPSALAATALGAAAWASDSRGAVLALVAAIATFGLLRGNTPVRLGVLGAGVVGLLVAVVVGPGAILTALTDQLAPEDVYGNSALYSGRPEMWAGALRVIGAAPLGLGVRGFEDANRMLKVGSTYTNAMHAHTDPLEIFVEWGPIAFFLVFPVIALLVVAARPALARGDDRGIMLAGFVSSLTAILLFSCADFPFRIGALATIAAVVGGAALGLVEEEPASFVATRLVRPLGGLAAATAIGLALLTLAATNRRSVLGSPDDRLRDGDGWLAHATAPDDQAMAYAREEYRLGLLARPLYGPLALRMARVEGKAGRRDAAREWLVLAARMDPTSPFAWRNLALVDRASGRDADARDAWRHLLALDADEGTWIGRAQEATKDASNLVDEVRDVVPRERWCLYASRLPPDRIAEADALFLAAGDQPDCATRWALWSFVRGEPWAALGHLGDAQGCLADQIRILSNNALGNYAIVDDLSQRTLRTCGAGDRNVRIATANARLALGNDNGLRILEGLLNENPDDAVARRALAEALARKGRNEEARRHYQYLVTSGSATADDRARLDTLD